MKKTIILFVVFSMFSGCYKQPIEQPIKQPINNISEEIKISDAHYFSDTFTACNCFLAIAALSFCLSVMFVEYSFFCKTEETTGTGSNDYKLGNRIVPKRGNNI